MPARRKRQIDPLELKPGDYVVHEQHGVGRYVEMKQREVQGATREYLVLEYGASQAGQPAGPALRADRPARPGHPLRRRRAAEPRPAGRRRLGQAQGPGPQGGPPDRRRADQAVRRAAGDQGARVRAGHPVAARAGGRVPVRGDARPAVDRRRGQAATWSRSCRWTGWSAATSATARPRSRCGRRSRPCRTASRSPCSCPPRCWCSSTSRRSRSGCRGFPVVLKGAVPLPDRQGGGRGHRGPARGHGRHRHRHPPAAQPRHQVQEPRAGRRRRGAAVRRRAQGAAEAAAHRRSTCSPMSATPIPRTLEMAITGIREMSTITTPPEERHPVLTLRRRLRGPPGHRRHPARAAPRGAGVLHPQPGAVDREGRRPDPPAGARGPGRHRARADGGAPARAGDGRLLGEALRRAGVHDDRRVGPRRLQRQHDGRSSAPTCSACPSCTSCAAGSAAAASVPTPTSCTRPTSRSPRPPTSGWPRSPSTPTSAAAWRSR